MTETKTESVILFSPSAGLIAGHYDSYTAEISKILVNDNINFRVIAGPDFLSFWDTYFPNSKNEVKITNTEINRKSFFSGFLDCLSLFNRIPKKNNPQIIMLDFSPPPKVFFGILVSLVFHKVKNVSGVIHHFPTLKKSWNLRFFNLMVYLLLIILNKKGLNLHCHNIEAVHNYGNKLKISYLNYGVSNNHTVMNKKTSKFNRILFFGGIYKNKGILKLLRAARLLENRDILLSIYGQPFDISDKEIYSQVRDLRHVEFFPGFFDDNEISAIFNSHDILVLPYDKTWSGTSGPLHLAIEFNLPVIVSDVYHFKYIVEQYSIGIVDNLNTPLSIAKSIIRSVYKGRIPNKNFELARNENSFEVLVKKLKGIHLLSK